MRTQLLGYLRSQYADIFIEKTHEWEDDAVIYTTESGLRQVQDALNTIVNDEIPEVAKQIGEAASHGDLSENAEYHAYVGWAALESNEMRDALRELDTIVFFTAGNDLDRYVVWDYVQRKREIIA